MPALHHAAIRVRSLEASLRFWCEGLGFEVLMDHTFDGDWETLLGAPATSLRAVFLGDPGRADAGIVELVEIGDVPDGAGLPPVGQEPGAGPLLLSVMTGVDATLARLAGLGLGGAPRRIEVAGVTMAVVSDPDGGWVELVDNVASDNLDQLASARTTK